MSEGWASNAQSEITQGSDAPLSNHPSQKGPSANRRSATCDRAALWQDSRDPAIRSSAVCDPRPSKTDPEDLDPSSQAVPLIGSSAVSPVSPVSSRVERESDVPEIAIAEPANVSDLPDLDKKHVSIQAAPEIAATVVQSVVQSVQSVPSSGDRALKPPVASSASEAVPTTVSERKESPIPTKGRPSAQALRLSQLPDDPDLGRLRVRNCDPVLGCLRVKPPRPSPPPKTPIAYISWRFDYYRSTNIFAGVDSKQDNLLRPAVSVSFLPPLGRNTYLSVFADGSLVRYGRQADFNYNDFRLGATLLQRLSPTMWAGLGWDNQQLFVASDDLIVGRVSERGIERRSLQGRFLNEHAIRLDLSRQDQLAPRLKLNTFYQLRVGFVDPVEQIPDRSRVINSLVASLAYDVRPNLQAGVDYQMALQSFTKRDRQDFFQQVSARLTYKPTRQTQMNIFTGLSFGNSTEKNVNFDGFIFGVSVSVGVPLF